MPKKTKDEELKPLVYKPNKNKALSKRFEFSKLVIESDNFDIKNFERVLNRNKHLKKLYEQGAKDYPQFKELQQDVYDALYKYKPRKLPYELIDSEYILNSEVMDLVMEAQKYRELRELTRLDKVNSAVGTEVLGEEVKEIVEKLLEEHKEMIEQMKQAQQLLQQAMQDQDGQEGDEGEGSCGAKPGGDGDEEGKAQQRLSLEEAQRIMDENRAKLKNKVRKEVEHRIHNAVAKATEKTQEISDYITNWGLGTDANYGRTGYQNKMKLIDRIKNSDKLKHISKLAGRYRRLAMKSKKLRVKKAETDIQDLTLGNDIAHLVATESALLKMGKAGKKIFMKKYIDLGLAQYQLGGETTLGMGPMVVCIDSSGSMSGDPEIWAKAVALSLLEISRKQRRNFFAIHFDAGSKQTLHTNEFIQRRKFSADQAIDMAEYFAGGGTNFEEPLSLAKDKIDDDKEFERADIIFITDGHCGIGDSWVKKFNSWRNRKHVGVYSVLINCTNATNVSVNLFSDKVVTLDMLKEEEGAGIAKDIFQHVQ